jgi:hypothetical protein
MLGNRRNRHLWVAGLKADSDCDCDTDSDTDCNSFLSPFSEQSPIPRSGTHAHEKRSWQGHLAPAQRRAWAGCPCHIHSIFGAGQGRQEREQLLLGLLLGEAMQCAEAKDKINGVNADHGAVLEELTKNAEGNAIVWIVEGWNDYGSVADIKVCIARRQPVTVEEDGFRHRQRHDLRL